MFAIGLVLFVIGALCVDGFDWDNWFTGLAIVLGCVLMFASIIQLAWIWLP